MRDGLLDLLQPDTILLRQSIKSKKRALGVLGELLAHRLPQTDSRTLTDLLLMRERLGSTGWGEGVAIPHCRVPDLERFSIVLLTLTSGVDFEAADGKAVDVFIGVAAPEDQKDAHLEYLAEAAKLLHDPRQVELLRSSHDSARLLNTLRQAE